MSRVQIEMFEHC